MSLAAIAQRSGGEIRRPQRKENVRKPRHKQKTINQNSQQEQPPQEVEGYNVTFRCNVPSANLTIDGNLTGAVNAGSRYLRTGQHTIKLQADGYELLEQAITISSTSTIFHFTMNETKQLATTPIEDMTIYEKVDQMPQFPGGDAALMQFLSYHIKYPVIAEKEGIQGRVVCTFVIERDGSIVDIKVINSVAPSLDKEAVRVIKSMPKWFPGKKNGTPVRVKYTFPVTFRLQ